VSLRITAGELRGRKVPVQPEHVRPTSERARQAFFNVVGSRIQGASFLDLFSGSGIFSFEAVSRGAKWALAIDQSRRNVEVITRIAREWNANVEAMPADVVRALARLGDRRFDVVYADPPYDYEHYDDLVSAIGRQVRLGSDPVVAVEHRRRTQPFTLEGGPLILERTLQYGEVWISFFSQTQALQ
jgi:16S rRNA (guanine966-N2)-methyltransferase